MDNHDCEKINIYMFPVLTDLLRHLELGHIFIFRQRKKRTQQRRKQKLEEEGEWEMENFEKEDECQHSYECCRVCNLSTIKL
jgi:hypothetical protein